MLAKPIRGELEGHIVVPQALQMKECLLAARPWTQAAAPPMAVHIGWTPAQRGWWCWGAVQPLSAPSTSCSWQGGVAEVLQGAHTCAHPRQVFRASAWAQSSGVPRVHGLHLSTPTVEGHCVSNRVSARQARPAALSSGQERCCSLKVMGELTCCTILAQACWYIM